MLIDAERLLLLRRALADALTPRQRTILHRHFGERLSYRAIAEGLGMSESGVRRELFLALDLVRAVVGSSDG